MRKFYPNLDGEDVLETVLEIPIPEKLSTMTKNKLFNFRFWKKSNPGHFSVFNRNYQIQILLGVIGAPLIPLPISSDNKLSRFVKNDPIESSMAKYIIHQYIAAIGGDHALNSVDSMYAIGKVKMMASEFSCAEGLSVNNQRVDINTNVEVKGMKHGGEVGSFVLWSKRPDLWCLELVVSGIKINAGCDGIVAWRQTPWHDSHASRGLPRPLRRSLQGLDPRLTANLFTNSICIGERTVNGEDCFVLKLEANPKTVESRSSNKVEIIRHIIWGYFSQKTGLLVQLEDFNLLRLKTSKSHCIFWETTMESSIQDYRTIDRINIAHSGKTSVSLFRYGKKTENHSKTRLEEVWSIEEVDFNIKGLTVDCFLPPADLKEEDEGFLAIVHCTKQDKSNNKSEECYKAFLHQGCNH